MQHEPLSARVIVVGAGPAGLALGACLKRSGVPCLLLEQAEHMAAAWHRHYDRLHLHSDKARSSLPFAAFPRDYPRYPSRLQVIQYLEAYARRFELTPLLGQRVVGARRIDGIWEVHTVDARFSAPHLVVAAGYNREPYLPTWPGEESFRGQILHSAHYRNGSRWRDSEVLVVGFGNSGGEIAIDLCEHRARVAIAVRGPVNVIPRELFGIPIVAIAGFQRKLPAQLVEAVNGLLLRAVMGDLSRYGLRKPPFGPMAQIRLHGRIPLLDVGTIELIRRGRVAVRTGIERFTATGVVFTDGRQQDFDAVILATGYRPRVDEFIRDTEGVLDSQGTPLSSGRESSIPGLYFCGYRVSPFGMLRDIAREARDIAADIAAKEARTPAA